MREPKSKQPHTPTTTGLKLIIAYKALKAPVMLGIAVWLTVAPSQAYQIFEWIAEELYAANSLWSPRGDWFGLAVAFRAGIGDPQTKHRQARCVANQRGRGRLPRAAANQPATATVDRRTRGKDCLDLESRLSSKSLISPAGGLRPSTEACPARARLGSGYRPCPHRQTRRSRRFRRESVSRSRQSQWQDTRRALCLRRARVDIPLVTFSSPPPPRCLQPIRPVG